MGIFNVGENAKIDTGALNIKVSKLSQAEYDELVFNGGYDENTLYIIETENLDAENRPVVNVGYPEKDTDAASKAFVEDRFEELKKYVDDKFKKIADAI